MNHYNVELVLMVAVWFILGIILGIFIEELAEMQRKITEAGEWRTRICKEHR